MGMPDLTTVIQAVRDSRHWPFRSQEDLCAYSHACIVACSQVDANFGHLSKSGGQNHCDTPDGKFGAVDAVMYRPLGQVADFIVSAGFEPDMSKPEPTNAVSWGVGPEGEYPIDRWFAATPGDGTPIPIPPTPIPPDDSELGNRVALLESKVEFLMGVKADKTRVEAINDRMNAIDANAIHKGAVFVGQAPVFGGKVESHEQE